MKFGSMKGWVIAYFVNMRCWKLQEFFARYVSGKVGGAQLNHTISDESFLSDQELYYMGQVFHLWPKELAV